MKITLSGAQKVVAWIILAVIVALSVWDVFLLKDDVPGNTISAIFKHCTQNVGFTFAFGVLAGHVFWHKRGRETPDDFAWKPIRLVGVVVAALALAVWSYFSEDVVIGFLEQWAIVPFALIGMPAGRICWPQYADDIGA